jgi:dTDP-4-amino-4,6-dideoxygalactose transaminase
VTEFLPYGRQQITEEDIQAVCDALRAPLITQGPRIEAFEEAFAARLGARHAVAFANGTAALHGAMHASGAGPGDTALTTPIGFVASANCALFVGARPAFADVEPGTANLDTDAVASHGLGEGASVCVAVSMAGHPVDLAPLQQLRRSQGMTLIEDGSHALGARRSKMVGGDGLADMTTFSLHPVKHITAGEGGMVTTDDPELARRLRRFRTHGIVRGEDDTDVLKGPWHYEIAELGFNYRITDFQSALGLSQLKRLDDFIARRNEIAGWYRERLVHLEQVRLPAVPPDDWTHGYHLFVVRFPEGARRRAAAYRDLLENRIGTQLHYIPIPRHALYRKLGYEGVAETLTESEAYYREALSLPIFVDMTEADVDRVAEALERSVRRSIDDVALS